LRRYLGVFSKRLTASRPSCGICLKFLCDNAVRNSNHDPFHLKLDRKCYDAVFDFMLSFLFFGSDFVEIKKLIYMYIFNLEKIAIKQNCMNKTIALRVKKLSYFVLTGRKWHGLISMPFNQDTTTAIIDYMPVPSSSIYLLDDDSSCFNYKR
jgi:hypothetical protein